MPEIIKPLRDEIRRVTAEFDGVLTTNALYQLKLLDSVCKKTTRVVSLSAGTSASLFPKTIRTIDHLTLSQPNSSAKSSKTSPSKTASASPPARTSKSAAPASTATRPSSRTQRNSTPGGSTTCARRASSTSTGTRWSR